MYLLACFSKNRPIVSFMQPGIKSHEYKPQLSYRIVRKKTDHRGALEVVTFIAFEKKKLSKIDTDKLAVVFYACREILSNYFKSLIL